MKISRWKVCYKHCVSIKSLLTQPLECFDRLMSKRELDKYLQHVKVVK